MCGKPELLAPAGDWERLEAAVRFGADAVYLGGAAFGMRASQAWFTGERLRQAAEYCHARGARLYLTVNTLPRNRELDALPAYLRDAQAAGVDALILADLGVLSFVKRCTPGLAVHISTQAGVVNYAAAAMLHELGAARVVLARELSLEEIAELRAKTPPRLELEAFVHGAMCMSVSGRCLLSDYLTGRDANRGECAQPCRWRYHLVEEKRPGRFFPIGEDGAGSYLLNAKDLCMLPHLDRLAAAGVGSFKIEGRAKSAYYTAVVTNAYRIAVDSLTKTDWRVPDWLLAEVETVSHRPYSTGFYFGRPDQDSAQGGYVREWEVAALAERFAGGRLFVLQKNKFCAGDRLETVTPGERPRELVVTDLRDEAGNPLDAAPHPHSRVSFAWDGEAPPPGSLLRKRKATV